MDARGNQKSYPFRSWQDRWEYKLLWSVLKEIHEPTDLAYARSSGELVWMNAFRPNMKLIIDNEAVVSTILAVDGPLVVVYFDSKYYYRKCDGWVRDLAFERWLPHSP